MGCTSSTYNMPEPTTSTTGDNIDSNITPEDSRDQIKGDTVVYSNSREFEQAQVNPECEIKINQTKLSHHDNDDGTKAKGTDFDIKESVDTTPTERHDRTVEITEPHSIEENFISLKDVVEKVISENNDGGKEISNTIPLVVETQNVELDRQIEEIIKDSNVSGVVEEIENNEDKAKGSTSPTQSEDSRATRWEALADIAAELPPSLAVDPLTGQIYSLAK